MQVPLTSKETYNMPKEAYKRSQRDVESCKRKRMTKESLWQTKAVKRSLFSIHACVQAPRPSLGGEAWRDSLPQHHPARQLAERATRCISPKRTLEGKYWPQLSMPLGSAKHAIRRTQIADSTHSRLNSRTAHHRLVFERVERAGGIDETAS